MKKRRILLVIVAAVPVGTATWVLWPGEKEPEYQGKSLSYWFTNRSPAVVNLIEQENAIRTCGSNAVPWMLKQIAYNPSTIHVKFDRWTAKWPKPIRESRIVRTFRIDRKKLALHWSVPYQFGILGVEGTGAVSELTRMACAGNQEAVRALVSLGFYGVPGLIKVLDRGERVSRANVLRHIGYAPWFRTNTTFVAAALRHVSDQDVEVACAAAQLVADAHIDAPTAMPGLIGGLNHAHPTARRMCTYALSAYGAEAQPALPALKVLLTDPDAAVREDATNAVRLIDQ